MKRHPVLHEFDHVDTLRLEKIYKHLRWNWNLSEWGRKNGKLPTANEIANELCNLRDHPHQAPGMYLSTAGIGVTGEGKVFFDKKIEILYSDLTWSGR